MLKNTSTEYGAGTKLFHWISGVIVVGLLALGLVLEDLPDGVMKLQAYGLHKSFGITILSLTALRVMWHLYSKKPAPLDSYKKWEKTLSRVTHGSLYVLMLAMPLSGWLLSSAAGRAVSIFGLVTLPDLIAPSTEMRDLFAETHEVLSTFMMIILALHVAGALKHHIIDKDNTMRRMKP